MKAVREKTSGILFYLSAGEDIAVKEDGFYKNGCFYSMVFTSADFDVVEFDPGGDLVFVETHKYQDGVLSVADEIKFSQAKRIKGSDILQLRDMLLKNSDWTQAKDIPDAVSSKYATYRQALRDVPQQSGFPQNIVWPVKPE